MDKNEEQIRFSFDSFPDTFIVQCGDEIVYANPAGATLLGCKEPSELLGKSIWDFAGSKYRPIVQERCRQVVEEGSSAPQLDLELIRLDGHPVDVELTAIPSNYLSRPALQFILRDITARKFIENQIRQRNVELAAINAVAASLSRSLALGVMLEDSLECVVQLNILGEGAQGVVFLHEKATDAIRMAAKCGVPEDHPCLRRPPRVGECLCGFVVRTGQFVISTDCHRDVRHTRTWPSMPPHKDVCLPLKVHGNILGAMNLRLSEAKAIDTNLVNLLSSVADQISVAVEKAKLFDEVRQQSERLHVLSRRLAEAEDLERKQLARELHDRVGESLSALGINLGIIRKKAMDSDLPGLASFVDDSLDLVEKTTERVRDVMSELRPPLLDEYGLCPTLHWYGHRFSARTGIRLELPVDEGVPRLPSRTEMALFRIATEALNNVAKHAEASAVSVQIEFDEHTFRLEIADDGIGFDAERSLQGETDRCWGLQTMSERAEAVGGTLEIGFTSPGRGTRVIAEVPR